MDLCLGIVKANYDAKHPGMVQVTITDFSEDWGVTAWLPVAAAYAGKDYGVYFLPEKDEQVIVGFLGGDKQRGVVLGSLWNQKSTIPAGTEKNNVRSIVTKGGHKITLVDGDDAVVTVETTAGHIVSISDKDKKITLKTSDDKEKIVLDEGSGAIIIDADKSVSIKAQDIKLTGKLTAKGKTVSIESESNLDLKSKQTTMGGSAVKVESSGILTLKGSMTKIN